MIRFKLPTESDVFVIAEIGKNFIQTKEEQDVATYLKNAKELVDVAAESGADAVKFQTHNVEDEQAQIDITSPHFMGSDRYSWVKRNTDATPFEDFWAPLKKHCDTRGITFFSTPMSRAAAKKINELVSFWKVGSGDVTDHILLEYLFSTKKPIIISTGMVSLAELESTMVYFKGHDQVPAVLYCVSQYPAPAEYFNLATIERFKESYPDSIIGFSDHSLGYDIALAALKLGARVVEKHFSLSRELWGSDHKVSMTPEEMGNMVRTIRNGEYISVDADKYYGNPNRELEGAGNTFRPLFNKALVAAKDIPRGTVLTSDLLYALRPLMHLGGIPTQNLEAVEGKRVIRDVQKYDPITNDLIQQSK